MDAAWSVDGSLAKMLATARSEASRSGVSGQVSGQIALCDVTRGLHAISVAGRDLGGSLLSLADAAGLHDLAGVAPSDWFVRGPDLTAVYERTESRPLRLQFQWTRISPDSALRLLGGVELTLSVQTDRLDSLPELVVRSDMPCDRMEYREFVATKPSESVPFDDAVQAFIFQTPCGAYVEFSHPRFGVQSEADAAGVSHRLFQRRLEKGVILRSRIQSLFFQDSDLSPIRELALRFAAEPLPLTA